MTASFAPDAPFYDAREAQPREQREEALMAQLPGFIAHAQAYAPAYAQRLAGVNPASITDRAALARLPVLRKHELLALQVQSRAAGGPALGGYATVPPWHSGAPRVFASPGPLYEVQSDSADAWGMARALYAAGLRAGDLVHNSFSYHLVPAGAMLEMAAQVLGCTVFPGGTGQTEAQVQALHDLGADAYVGTPSFLRILLEKAEALGLALPRLRRALVSGEACPPPLVDWFAQRGVDVFQCYATADVGLIAYQTAAREGLVTAEDVIVEIVAPGGTQPLPLGEVGEVVVTAFNRNYPLLRFGTGDLSAELPGPCSTGRSNMRLRGWLGRADQTTKVRGMFVHPEQLHAVLARAAGPRRARLVVQGELGQDRLLLQIEAVAGEDRDAVLARWQTPLETAVRDIIHLRAEVQVLAVGSLPNDGQVIRDERVVT